MLRRAGHGGTHSPPPPPPNLTHSLVPRVQVGQHGVEVVHAGLVGAHAHQRVAQVGALLRGRERRWRGTSGVLSNHSSCVHCQVAGGGSQPLHAARPSPPRMPLGGDAAHVAATSKRSQPTHRQGVVGHSHAGSPRALPLLEAPAVDQADGLGQAARSRQQPTGRAARLRRGLGCA